MPLPLTRALVSAAFLFGGALTAAAQQSTTMQGMQMNKDQPVRIEAASLEVRDKQRQATFTGDVKLTQGDTTVKCRTLIVFYADGAAQKKGNADAKGGGGSSQQIEKAVAKGDVLVTQKDQTASGESGLFDMKSNTITMEGNVIVTQGSKVMRGQKMVVNMTTGVTTVDSSKGGNGRVEIMLNPGEPDKAPVPAAAPPAKGAAPGAKAAPKTPIKIN